MSRYFLIVFAAFFFLSGCARHYYRVKGDMVRIYLKKPNATVVHFASSHDGFKLHKAKRIDPETWEITTRASGEFRYFYIVDGVVYLPPCRLKEHDDFGSANCLYSPGM